jgi:hypothetical protein
MVVATKLLPLPGQESVFLPWCSFLAPLSEMPLLPQTTLYSRLTIDDSRKKYFSPSCPKYPEFAFSL